MLYPTMETLLRNVRNRYVLVNITAKRAREIAEYSEEDGQILDEKAVKLAIGEIAEGIIGEEYLN